MRNPALLVLFFLCAVLSWLAFQQDTIRQLPQAYYNIHMIGQDTVLAGEHVKQGEEMYNAGLLDSARNCFYRALKVYDKIPDDLSDSTVMSYKLNALFWAGFLSVYLNDLSTGEKFLRTCIDKATTRFTSRHYILSFAYIKLGYIYQGRGDRYKAYELIKNSYLIRAETMHDSTIWMRNGHGNMAWIAELVGKYDEALFHSQRLLAIAETYNKKQPIYLSSSHFRLAKIYQKMGQPDQAKWHKEKGLSLLENIYPPGHPGNLGYHRYLVEQYKSNGNYPAIIDLTRESIALSIKRSGENHPLTASYFNLMGDAWQKTNQPDSTLFYHQKALSAMLPDMKGAPYLEVPENLSPELDGAILLVLQKKAAALAWCHDHHGQERPYLQAALDYYLATIDLMDAKRMNFLTLASKEVLNEDLFPLFENALALALRLYEMTREDTYLQSAFFIMEKSKAMALLETVRGNQLEDSALLPSDARQAEFELKSNIAYLQKILTEEKSKPDSLQNANRIRDLSHHIFERNLEFDSLVEVFRKEYPVYYQMRHNASVAKLADVQAHLPEDAVLVEYFTGDSTLVVFTITNVGASVRSHRIDSTFFGQVNDLRRLMDQPGDGQQKTGPQRREDFKNFTALSRSLYETLLRPSLDGAPARQLVIVPDGVLGYLPFEALLTGEPANTEYNYRQLPYLFLEHTTRYEYSATLLLEPRTRRAASESYAGFAPVYKGNELLASRGEDSLLTGRVYGEMFRDDGLAGLLHNQDEIKETGALTDGATYLGQAAQERHFLQIAGRSRILHLAMHALTNDQEPSFSQLVFSQPDDTLHDGKLHVHEIYDLRLNADLAVLSACQTGAGKLRRGEGTMSLSRAFKAAGCPNLVVSLWRADDFSTKTIISAFFKNLKSGMGKDDALQAARRRFLFEEATESLAHPFYWSAFVLVGDDQPVPLGKGGWWWWAGAGMAAVLLAGWGWRKVNGMG